MSVRKPCYSKMGKIDDKSVKCLSACIHDIVIDALNFGPCKVTKLGIRNLSKAIEQRASPVNNKLRKTEI